MRWMSQDVKCGNSRNQQVLTSWVILKSFLSIECGDVIHHSMAFFKLSLKMQSIT